jgi:hypothetical protein
VLRNRFSSSSKAPSNGASGMRWPESRRPSGRPEATAAALIGITKSPAWWELAQEA